MTLGPIIVSIEGKKLSEDDRNTLRHDLIGGVILFSENYKNREQLMELVRSIKTVKSPELIVCVDQEGGRVQRFRQGFYKLPSFNELGSIYNQTKEEGLRASFLAAQVTALELMDVGIDFSFSPVIDIDHGLSDIIGDRSFHSNPEIVAELSNSYINGLKSIGMKAVVKHFPGHGGVTLDSHIVKPIDERSLNDLGNDLIPFQSLFNKDVSAIMTAHICFPSIDTSMVTFSEYWLNDLLRQKFQFQGLVFSDDLSMAATEEVGLMGERINLALSSGCDVVICCHMKDQMDLIIESVQSHHKKSFDSKLEVMRPSVQSEFSYENISEFSRELDHLLNNPT
jgi:beta-N-acetylhexosaminidase